LAQRRREFPVRRIVEVPAGYRRQVAFPQSLRLFHRLAILSCSFLSLSSGCVSQFQAGIPSCCRRMSSGDPILNTTTLHNVLLPGAGTGGKTCPCRAMMATSDTVRRFRLPVPGSRLGLYERGPYSTPVADCRLPVPAVVVFGRACNTRPASWAAKCCSASPFAVLFPGSRPFRRLSPSRSLVPVPAFAFMNVFLIPPRFPVAGSRRCLLPSWSPVPGPRSRRSCCRTPFPVPAVTFRTLSIGIVRFT